MSELAPIHWLINDLTQTIIDASPEELPKLYNKLEALAVSIQEHQNNPTPQLTTK